MTQPSSSFDLSALEAQLASELESEASIQKSLDDLYAVIEPLKAERREIKFNINKLKRLIAEAKLENNNEQ